MVSSSVQRRRGSWAWAVAVLTMAAIGSVVALILITRGEGVHFSDSPIAEPELYEGDLRPVREALISVVATTSDERVEMSGLQIEELPEEDGVEVLTADGPCPGSRLVDAAFAGGVLTQESPMVGRRDRMKLHTEQGRSLVSER